ncbi:NAD-glutamate dehydrogenase domain-containing protein [Rhodococcus sp. NPDC057529]|uniref:NAD-glutamate dehydrogenase domain-containing protein n=1 Tax=Rhodococcus sp. NPDC057529 TaxID=3346158 RepID=UPI00366A8992
MSRYTDSVDISAPDSLDRLPHPLPTEETALLDALPIGEVDARLALAGGSGSREAVMSLYVAGTSVRLSRILPILHGLGTEVIDEIPTAVVRSDGVRGWIYRFSIELGTTIAPGAAAERFIDAFLAVWRGETDSDLLNALVAEAGLTWREVSVVRAYARYLRQTKLPFSHSRIETVLRENAEVTTSLMALFTTRHDPTVADGDRADACLRLTAAIEAAIDKVAGLDADRILRAYLAAMTTTTRTNFFAGTSDALALKLEPRNLRFLPKPRPQFEIFVHSPRVEGVHLRFGSVARGGLRWSDRPEDFRTEILGLAKAQAVKNAVIVPVGAKGGFVVKHPPSSTGNPAVDQTTLHAEGVACYRSFIAAMLSVTDNRDPVSGAVIAPAGVVRHDGDDPYLVVAADKGTASFSDIANTVAIERDFWLGDAFASGGSSGYDHKAMGITARGAWESVKRHFREFGVDVQTQDFTVIGIGDMSGDVFGNGMLLSRHIRLVAAFDHRHIFLDPNPDSAASFDERKRLFTLPRSSWKDYSPAVISSGGGVYSRSAKSIPITTEIRDVLGLEHAVTTLAPEALIQRILQAPVDLLFNGGIGTYIKARAEDHLTVGDKANDAVRVDADQLRCRVIGEGGNLGLTQRARIEFNERGGRINTDALDNAGGVDCSDHEVNIKTLLQGAVRSGELSSTDRETLLASMTHEVAELVVANNHRQNETLGIARTNASRVAEMHLRHISVLAETGRLDRTLEVLPTAKELAQRPETARELTSPELATLLAHIKLALKAELLTDDLVDERFFDPLLASYFPVPLWSRFSSAIATHPLRREIVATVVANQVVDRGGITYAHRLAEEVGALGPDAVRAYYIAAEVFQLDQVWQQIRDAGLPTRIEDLLFIESSRILDRAARWLLIHRPQPLDITDEIARFAPDVASMVPKVRSWLHATDRRILAERSSELVTAGVPASLADDIFRLLDLFGLLDVVEVAHASGQDPDRVAELYYAVKDHLGINSLLQSVSGLDRTDRWNSLARMALREDLYSSVRAVTAEVLTLSTSPSASAGERLRAWEDLNAPRLRQARVTLDEITASEVLDLARLSVAARQLRSMITTAG